MCKLESQESNHQTLALLKNMDTQLRELIRLKLLDCSENPTPENAQGVVFEFL